MNVAGARAGTRQARAASARHRRGARGGGVAAACRSAAARRDRTRTTGGSGCSSALDQSSSAAADRHHELGGGNVDGPRLRGRIFGRAVMRVRGGSLIAEMIGARRVLGDRAGAARQNRGFLRPGRHLDGAQSRRREHVARQQERRDQTGQRARSTAGVQAKRSDTHGGRQGRGAASMWRDHRVGLTADRLPSTWPVRSG